MTSRDDDDLTGVELVRATLADRSGIQQTANILNLETIETLLRLSAGKDSGIFADEMQRRFFFYHENPEQPE